MHEWVLKINMNVIPLQQCSVCPIWAAVEIGTVSCLFSNIDKRKDRLLMLHNI